MRSLPLIRLNLTTIYPYDRSGYDDGTVSIVYVYDDMVRKITETISYGPFSKSFSYIYYGNSLKETFTAPDNMVYTYLYGTNNE